MNYGLSFTATPCIHLPSRLEQLSCPEDVATSRWCPPVVFVNLCLWHINEKMVDIDIYLDEKNAEPTVLGVMFIHLTSINQLYIHDKAIKSPDPCLGGTRSCRSGWRQRQLCIEYLGCQGFDSQPYKSMCICIYIYIYEYCRCES
jgi:hypothetical protein